MIQLGRLEGFYRVAIAEGYARAARAFPYPITQPGVHQMVRRLEAELGVVLFERTSKDRVVLTPAGRMLFDHVAPFLEGLPSVVERLRGGVVGGTLRIHASGHALREVLPPWLARIEARRPDIELALFESREPAIASLRAGEADLVVDHFAELPDDLEARVVANARPFLVLPATHPLAERKRLTLARLGDMPFVAFGADRHLRRLQLAALAEAGVAPRRLHGADSAETILALVAAGLGYSLLAWVAPGGPRRPGIAVHPMRVDAPGFPIHAAWRRSAAGHPLVEAALALAPEVP